MSLQIMQSICTKPRIYLTYDSYLGTIYDFFIIIFSLNKLYMIHLIERYMLNNNNKTIQALQGHVRPFMLMLSSLVCLSRFGFNMYFSTATCFFNLALFIFLCSNLNSFNPFKLVRARSLVVNDLRSETKGSRFESGC